MLSSSANCMRMPPAALLVEPDASVSRSSSTTSATPSRRRLNAVAAPRAPPPITTTSAVSADAAQELPERLPVAARSTCPLDHALLLDREVVRRRRLDRDPRVDERVLRGIHVVQRLPQARPCRVLACVLKGIHERPRNAHPIDDVSVAPREARRERWHILI